VSAVGRRWLRIRFDVGGDLPAAADAVMPPVIGISLEAPVRQRRQRLGSVLCDYPGLRERIYVPIGDRECATESVELRLVGEAAGAMTPAGFRTAQAAIAAWAAEFGCAPQVPAAASTTVIRPEAVPRRPMMLSAGGGLAGPMLLLWAGKRPSTLRLYRTNTADLFGPR
jgi:hypothetical protein